MGNYFTIDNNYIKYIELLGLNSEQILRRADIPIKAVCKEPLSISTEKYVTLMEQIGEVISDKQIIEFSNIDRIMMFIPPIFAALCSNNGLQCFNRLSKYKSVIGPFKLRVDATEIGMSLRFEFSEQGVNLPRFTILTEQVLMTNIIRKATGLDIKPIRVASPYEYGEEFKDFFGITPSKESTNVIEFSMYDVKQPFLTENNTMWEFMEPELIKRMEELETDDSYSAKVRRILFESIPGGQDSINYVSKELALSIRSLQRRLSEENTTYIKQLNHTRELLARNYFKDKSLTNDDIAFLLGYSDANAFQRAFRGWTGVTVGEYRRRYR